MRIGIVIPTYRRGQTLLDSLRHLLALEQSADEVLVVDQTVAHPGEVEASLRALHEAGSIRWLRLDRPSIPHAMNVGLREATSDVVLFLDDDIVPGGQLVAAHLAAHADATLVAGMVLQPGEQPVTLRAGDAFLFTSDAPARIREFMGGNFSVRRDLALMLGGFDENFVGAAYRFEAEFAHRYVARHGLIRYEPTAVIDHLQIATGGTRAHGHHLRTLKPLHSVGAYYFLLRARPAGWLRQFLWRPLRSVRTRHHLRRPWWIPLTLFSELRGMWLAWRLFRHGPRLIGAA